MKNAMLKISLALGFLLIRGFSFADVSKIEIRILPESIVYDEGYSLGDIAELDGFDVKTIQKLASVKLGRSPLPGKSYILRPGIVKARIRNKHKLEDLEFTFPKKALISRASVKISGEELRTLVRRQVEKEYKQYSEVKIEVKSPLRDFYVPKGKVEYTLKRVGKRLKVGGYSSWDLNILRGKKPVKRFLIRVHVDVYDEVTVAKGTIERGKIIGPGDLATIKKNISNRKSSSRNPSAENLVGQEARRTILKNETLKESLTDDPVVVREGNRVVLFYKNKSMELRVTAKALRSGKIGDSVPVKNIRSKKIVQAIVIDSKLVKVAL